MSINDFCIWHNEIPAPGKENTHNIRECIFTCPHCGAEISNASYINFGYFQRACHNHLDKCHVGATLVTENKKET